jgi:hypothetical protein
MEGIRSHAPGLSTTYGLFTGGWRANHGCVTLRVWWSSELTQPGYNQPCFGQTLAKARLFLSYLSNVVPLRSLKFLPL